MLERVDGRIGDTGLARTADVELTPIFQALAIAAERGPDPDERFRRDPLAAPLPASVQPVRATTRMMLRLVSDPRPESGSANTVEHAAPESGSAPFRAQPALKTGSGRHRSLRAVSPDGAMRGHSST